MKSSSKVVCDLCHKQKPYIYCSSDTAFLCFDCDLHVHSANFLVARHIRHPLCSLCKSYHHSRSSCNGEQLQEHDDHDCNASSSSSNDDCISSTDGSCSATKTTISCNKTRKISSDWKTREVLENWCSRLGISNKVVIAEAAFQVWWIHRSRIWPYRVGLAASLWLGLLRSTNNRIKMSTLLKRLEDISGVPAKSIVIAQSKLTATSKMMKRTCEEDNVEESWAEC